MAEWSLGLAIRQSLSDQQQESQVQLLSHAYTHSNKYVVSKSQQFFSLVLLTNQNSETQLSVASLSCSICQQYKTKKLVRFVAICDTTDTTSVNSSA